MMNIFEDGWSVWWTRLIAVFFILLVAWFLLRDWFSAPLQPYVPPPSSMPTTPSP
ncbi:protein of unknown function [Nitrospira japonica]|uniref:Uncharacterized protein n=1 Tax=Nitrospira japonica TaxID=1325564 RepID=A0A1W1I0N3_9BACT|nr:protein of unknown function [Nitrospira japonica]